MENKNDLSPAQLALVAGVGTAIGYGVSRLTMPSDAPQDVVLKATGWMAAVYTLGVVVGRRTR